MSVLVIPDDLSIVLRLTVTLIGTLPLLSTTPTTFSLPLASINDCCFVILIELSSPFAVAMASEGSGKIDDVRIINYASADNNMPTITLVLLLRSLRADNAFWLVTVDTLRNSDRLIE